MMIFCDYILLMMLWSRNKSMVKKAFIKQINGVSESKYGYCKLVIKYSDERMISKVCRVYVYKDK